MTAYYNENDPFAAAWLREIIAEGLIAPGDVDTRSIVDVRPGDLAGYTQCHFFAGIGGWSYALRLAGWPDGAPVWTGSCPCQPFSAAGKRRGNADERHLWPVWFDLIRQCRPDVVFGEQVEAAIRMGWLDGIRADLEGARYALGAAVLGAHSVGAPHIRQRLYWMADSASPRHDGRENAGTVSGSTDTRLGERGQSSWRSEPSREGASGDGLADASITRAGRDTGAASGEEARSGSAWRTDEIVGGDASVAGGAVRRLAHADGQEQSGLAVDGEVAGPGGAGGLEHATRDRRQQRRAEPGGRSVAGGCGEGGLGDTDDTRSQGRLGAVGAERAGQRPAGPHGPCGPGFWSRAEWLACSDGKARRVESGIQPLAHGVPNRVGTLRGAGNAIVPELAAEFIAAYLDVTR